MLQGIDVSSYQSSDYDTDGLAFVFIKVTEGLSYVNPTWVAQRQTARDAGLVVGFYHYPHIDNDPVEEADYFLDQINLMPGDIIVLDWEWYGQDVSDESARAYRAAWLTHVKTKAPGHKIGIYSDRNNWRTVDTDSTVGDFLWIADYVRAGAPRIAYDWTFHQYTDEPLDKNVADFPSLDALRQWAGTGTSSPCEPFPGADWFRDEPDSPIVTAMGRRLVAEGCSAYTEGPSSQWTDADKLSYQRWQRKLGYSGTDADGWPGPASWDALRVPKI
ncbi:GH25 family lysozyme [Streptomyces olivoreticuli]|uniref:GH25 family lysozyme n=1 Tax=Streptomyces olivoreticuli TaxID=68246 RepID=UPI003462D950